MHYDSQNIPSFFSYIFLMTILNSSILQNNRSSMTQHAGKKVITSMRRKGLFFPQSNLRCKSVSMAFQSFSPFSCQLQLSLCLSHQFCINPPSLHSAVEGFPKKSNPKHILLQITPPVDLHWFFEISIRTEKKFQLQLKKKFSQFILKWFLSCSNMGIL